MRTSAWMLAIGLCAAGCGGPTHREVDEYTGCSNDEQFMLLEDGEAHAIVDDTQAPQVIMPAPNTTVPFATKVNLVWNQNPTNPGDIHGDVPFIDGVNGCNACCPMFEPGALMDFGQGASRFEPLHLPPLSGDIYDLHFTVDGRYDWRLITNFQEWIPTDDTWNRWRGKTVSVQIWRLNILRNQPSVGQMDPYTSNTPFVFHVGS
jgi:hypothetical protein